MKNEFLAIEDIPNIDDGKQRYDMFVKAYNETREHGVINGLIPSEVFLQRLITSSTHNNKQQSVTHVGNQKCKPICVIHVNYFKDFCFFGPIIIHTSLSTHQ